MSSRLECRDDIKVTEKAINRVEANDAFLHKGKFYNPFSVLNSDNDVFVGCG